ncbi:MAG: hypothetical protein K9M84_11620 [Spirochaetia bacterium]|nr:hypothetical protein [Spirochaetia bacterium]
MLITTNFIIQMYYFKVPSRTLHVARRITTPGMLFWSCGVMIITTGQLVFPEVLLLLAMGIGELGIEGSQVVESQAGRPPESTPWTVTAAGILFLLVNVFLGIVLFIRTPSVPGIMIGTCGVGGLVLLIDRFHVISRSVRLQLRLYGAGLAVLASGACASLLAEPGYLAFAGMILTLSDSLVLWRMGAGWNKAASADRRKLRTFLVLILLLYYAFMAVLIDGVSPFFR